MKRNIFSLTAAICISLFTLGAGASELAKESSMTFSVSGKVLDIATGEALAGVKVEIEETSTFTYSDFEGNFYINNLYPGSYQLKTSYISYEKGKLFIDLENQNEEKIEVKLEQLSSLK